MDTGKRITLFDISMRIFVRYTGHVDCDVFWWESITKTNQLVKRIKKIRPNLIQFTCFSNSRVRLWSCECLFVRSTNFWRHRSCPNPIGWEPRIDSRERRHRGRRRRWRTFSSCETIVRVFFCETRRPPCASESSYCPSSCTDAAFFDIPDDLPAVVRTCWNELEGQADCQRRWQLTITFLVQDESIDRDFGLEKTAIDDNDFRLNAHDDGRRNPTLTNTDDENDRSQPGLNRFGWPKVTAEDFARYLHQQLSVEVASSSRFTCVSLFLRHEHNINVNTRSSSWE